MVTSWGPRSGAHRSFKLEDSLRERDELLHYGLWLSFPLLICLVLTPCPRAGTHTRACPTSSALLPLELLGGSVFHLECC